MVWIGIASELVVVALIVYTPLLQRMVGTESIPLLAWLWLVPLIPLLVIADGLRKAVDRTTPTDQKEVTGT